MIELVVLLAYASLAVELVAFPVPSVASTPSILRTQPGRLLSKLILYALPTGFSIAFFLTPLCMMAWPPLRDGLGPIGVLENPTVTAVGLILIVAGRVLTFSSVLLMRGGEARLFRPVRPRGLRQRRLFSRSRNPGLVGMFAFYAGLVLVFPCWALMLGVPLYFGNMHWRVLLEEGFLANEFGDSYRAYRAETRRYL